MFYMDMETIVFEASIKDRKVLGMWTITPSINLTHYFMNLSWDWIYFSPPSLFSIMQGGTNACVVWCGLIVSWMVHWL
jgi:hypothetical protein